MTSIRRHPPDPGAPQDTRLADEPGDEDIDLNGSGFATTEPGILLPYADKVLVLDFGDDGRPERLGHPPVSPVPIAEEGSIVLRCSATKPTDARPSSALKWH